MKNRLKVMGAGVVGAGVIAASSLGFVSAATTGQTGNVGSSTIPRTVFRQERLQAASEVLHASTTDIQTAHKNHTMSQLLSKASLTRQTFGPKMKAQLTADLKAKGYSQDQITIALQHRHIVRMHHRMMAKS